MAHNSRCSKVSTHLSLIVLVMLVSGCASTKGHWGSGVTLTPGWGRVWDSAVNAAIDPLTWVPLARAVVFTYDDWDEKVVDWAVDNTPIFGDVDDADDRSSNLRTVSYVNAGVAALVVPSGTGSEMVLNKTKGMVAGLAVVGLNGAVTEWIKSSTDRQRPDSDSTNSFPSGHTSSATIAATLAARTIDQTTLTPTQKTVWKVGSYGVAVLTGWARVEAGRHYPSDVLAGFALGHFLGAFLNDAFINPNARDEMSLEVDVTPDRTVLLSFNHRL